MLLKVVTILGSMLMIFWQDLEVVAIDALNSEIMNYVLVIPFFIAYALYRKRRMLQAVSTIENQKRIERTELVSGASLLASSFLLFWYGSYTFYRVEYHLLSMPIFLAGSLLLTFNWQTLRQLAFPLVLLILLEPLPLQVANAIGFQISALSSTAAYSLLKFFDTPVTLTTLQTPIITVETLQGREIPLAIDVACSGLYSLTGFAVFAVFAAFILRGQTWKRAVLFSSSFPMMYGLNIARVAAIVWIAHMWGEGAAMQTFHLLGGSVLIFIATLLLLTLGEKVGKLKIFAQSVTRESCPLCKESLEKGESFCPYCGKFLKPGEQKVTTEDAAKMALVVALVVLFIPIQVPPFALVKGTASIDLETFSAEELKNQILPEIPGWDLEFLYRDRNVEYWAKWDAALVYYYRKQGEGELQPIVFVLIQVMSGRHTWEASLYQWPAQYGYPTATMLVERDVSILSNPQITGRFLMFKRVGSTMPEAIIYWFEKALFTINGTVTSRYVSISLDAYPDDLKRAGMISGSEDVDKIQAVLLPMARSIAEHWQPLITWTLINISLGQWAAYVLALTLSPCAVVVALLLLRLRSDRKKNAQLLQRLSHKEERDLLAVISTSSKILQTGISIEAMYYVNTGKEMEPRTIIETLEDAVKVGLVNRSIVSSEDEPVLVWKNNF